MTLGHVLDGDQQVAFAAGPGTGVQTDVEDALGMVLSGLSEAGPPHAIAGSERVLHGLP